jgi:uncharacterized membrane protein YdjX (TVP38/TMEM64 family)
MTDPARRPNRALLLKLGVVAGMLVVAAVVVARGLDLRLLLEQGLVLIRSAGPVAFFVAMALLPACGVPMLIFSLSVVSLFEARWGTVPVLLLALAALTANMALTYALARRGLRPLLEKLVTRLGYRLPQVEAGDATDLVAILRLTPGIPFFVQNYLAGLAEVPFGKYLLVSCILTWPVNVAFMLFGDALIHGKGKVALIALSLLLALTAGTHLVRRHYSRKKTRENDR